MQIELSDTGDLDHRAAVLAPLAAHNQAATGRAGRAIGLGIFLRDAEGTVEGGMFGDLGWDWFKLHFAFVPPHRRNTSVGGRMLETLEAEIFARGGTGVWLNTSSYHAPNFYRKSGYHLVGELRDRPPGHTFYTFARTEGLDRSKASMVVQEAPDEADMMAVRKHLEAYGEAYVGPSDRKPFALLVRDDSGAIVGGQWGRSGKGWLFIDLFGLPPEMRRQGLGRRLMAMAEDEARRRGCVGVWLDTFSFQARPFYEKLGFTVFGELRDYPPGHTRWFLSKRLDR